MREFQCFLFVLMQSYTCFYVICMTVPLSITSLVYIRALFKNSNEIEG